MARGLDHVVHVVRDLEAAADFYGRLGFTVGARNQHPWGTHNRLVQLPGFFLEILTAAEPEKIPPHSEQAFSFGAFNRDFLAQAGEGLSCMVLESDNTAADKTALEQAGFGGFDLLNFSRKGKRADGSDTEVGFSLAFARYPASPHAAFFTCKQTHPENFWSPALQRHANGAQAISACALVAENPSDHHIFLEAFTGVRAPHASSLGLTMRTPRGVVLAFDRRGFRDTYGLEPPTDEGLRLAALAFKVDDPDKLRAACAKAGIRVREAGGRLVVPAEAAFGAVLVFEAS
ncbi:MAG: VOC family protein [Bradyrhizobiaceae bacterium]|nr:VOC family protein [Bradyrhizobiaceae bacterium]